jgi:hypothetical protein
MLLDPEETLLENFRDGKILLTNHRLAKEVHGWHHSFIQSVPLEKIATIEHKRNKQSLLLMLAGISLLSGMLAVLLERPWALGPTVAVAVILAGIYSYTRTNYVFIAGENVHMKIDVTGWSKEEIQHLITRIEEARRQKQEAENHTGHPPEPTS